MSLHVAGKDILKFNIDGSVYPYRWRNFKDITEWFEDNIEYILREDDFPIAVSGNSAAEFCEVSYNIDLNDIEKYELLQEWMFRHSWFSVRAGSYLADVYFRKVNNKIEISWNNTNTFKEDNIKYIYPKGKYDVDVGQFCEVVEKFIFAYGQL